MGGCVDVVAHHLGGQVEDQAVAEGGGDAVGEREAGEPEGAEGAAGEAGDPGARTRCELDGHRQHVDPARHSLAANGLYAIRLGGSGDVTGSHVEWTWKRSLPNVPSPILMDGVLYVLKEGGVLTALDPATGETHSAGRIEGAEEGYYASPVAAGDHILTASQGGKVALIAAGAEWEVLEVADFEEEIWATPALAQDGLYLRTQSALYAFGTPDDE